MGFNINNFKAQGLTRGGARPSLFEVTLTFPTIGTVLNAAGSGVTSSNVKDVDTTLTFLCKASAIPSSTISPIEVPYFGRKVKYAGNRTFPEWTITVINDEDFKVRQAFEEWLAGINGHQDNLYSFSQSPTGGVLTGSYQTSGTVVQYTKDNTAKRTYSFKNVFPSEISPIELNWGSENEIEEYTVTLQYDYWTVNDPSSSSSSKTGSGSSGGNGTGGTGGTGGAGGGGQVTA